MQPKDKIVSLIDYTSLSGEENQTQIRKLAREAHTPLGTVAAVCVYPRYVSLVKDAFVHFQLPVLPVAAVVNFPSGELPLEEVIAEIHYALQQGADEIDLVMPHPYAQYSQITQSAEQKLDFLQACRREIHGKVLKLIVESGQLSTEELTRACEIGLAAEVDFLKTSTGKVAVGATLEAAETMLKCIRNSGKRCGFKPSGGLRSQAEAESYLALAASIMGADFLRPQTFRLGASSLLATLLQDS